MLLEPPQVYCLFEAASFAVPERGNEPYNLASVPSNSRGYSRHYRQNRQASTLARPCSQHISLLRRSHSLHTARDMLVLFRAPNRGARSGRNIRCYSCYNSISQECAVVAVVVQCSVATCKDLALRGEPKLEGKREEFRFVLWRQVETHAADKKKVAFLLTNMMSCLMP
jgi:hypothetical protein